MGIENQLARSRQGFEIIASFPELKGKPIVIGESDPEGCAACSSRVIRRSPIATARCIRSYTAP